MTTHLKLIFFSSKDCGTCKHVKKNVMPLLKKDLPDLVVEEVSISLDGPGKDTLAEARADAHGVRSVPAFRFEVVGFPVGEAEAATLSGLKSIVREAQKALKMAGGGENE